MKRKLFVAPLVLLLVASMAYASVAQAANVELKNNDKFENYAAAFSFDYSAFVKAEYIASEEALAGEINSNRIEISMAEIVKSYTVKIGEGDTLRTYTAKTATNPNGDFTYSGIMTLVAFDPILPYAYNKNDPYGTLFMPARMQHFRVDYTFDFGNDGVGLDGTISFIAEISGNGAALTGDKAMHIVSISGTEDFRNVQVSATRASGGHLGIVSGWPE